MIQLVEVCELLSASKNSSQKFTVREVYINPKHVVSMREDVLYKQKLTEGILPSELDDRQRFTRITLDKGQTGLEIVVVGEPRLIETKLYGESRELLLG